MKTILALSFLGSITLLAAPTLAQETKPAPPAKKMPYVAVHNPAFVPAAQATFMKADDPVIGLLIGDTAKAYPAGILGQHGLIEDDAPKGPIAITW